MSTKVAKRSAVVVTYNYTTTGVTDPLSSRGRPRGGVQGVTENLPSLRLWGRAPQRSRIAWSVLTNLMLR